MNSRYLRICILLIASLALQEFALGKELLHPEKEKPSDAFTKLFKFTRTSIKKEKLKTKSEDVLPPLEDQQKPFFRQRLSIKVNGTPKAIRTWLKNLHSLDDFRAIASLTIHTDRDNPKLQTCTIEIHQWHAPVEVQEASKNLKKRWNRIKKEVSKTPSAIDSLKEIDQLAKNENGISLTGIEINQGLGISDKRTMTISIEGLHKDVKPIGDFRSSILAAKAFMQLDWVTQVPTKRRDGKWHFVYTGEHVKKPKK